MGLLLGQEEDNSGNLMVCVHSYARLHMSNQSLSHHIPFLWSFIFPSHSHWDSPFDGFVLVLWDKQAILRVSGQSKVLNPSHAYVVLGLLSLTHDSNFSRERYLA